MTWVDDFNRGCIILSIMLMVKTYISHEMLKNSYHFIMSFSNYSLYQGEHLEVLLYIYTKQTINILIFKTEILIFKTEKDSKVSFFIESYWF